METLQAILLGLTQGVTEFIPVSSSGHLEMVQELLGGRSDDFHLFIEFINFGTLLALLIYYRERIKEICNDVFREKNFKMLRNIILTSIPAALAGFFLSDLIENNSFFSNLDVIVASLGIVGIIMIVIDKLPHMKPVKDENHLDSKRAFAIGMAQTLALIPGVSRSGSTIIAGRLTGMNSKSSAEYSFLASIPIMCGVILKSFISESSRMYMVQNFWSLILANAVAFAFGMMALKFVLKYLHKNDALKNFGWYRVSIALLYLVMVLIR